MGSSVAVISSNLLFQNMPISASPPPKKKIIKNPDLNFSFSPSWSGLGNIPSTDIYKSTKDYKNVSACERHLLDLVCEPGSSGLQVSLLVC